MASQAVLLLEDGTFFEGKAAGVATTAIGELCFNTGMTGYQELFSDPSYFGQILVNTHVHIGNYGAIAEEVESDKMQIAGLVCKDFNDNFSRQKDSFSLQKYFERYQKPVIYNIDTRSIVRYIRDRGVMNAILSTETSDIDQLRQQLLQAPSMQGLELASMVSTPQPYFFGNPAAQFKVAVLDFGVKRNMLRCLAENDCYVQVFPAKTTFKEMATWQPDGYFVSNGPGDPASMDYAVATVQNILAAEKPLFGICLGHQLLALANGCSTYKMHHGHRGINQPVLNLKTGRGEITSQNHGFVVDTASVEAQNEWVEITHRNLNDQSVEGISVRQKPAFSVQYHPEASPGTHDSRYLFQQFSQLMLQYKV
ncbi:MAG: glutamine-hydrolyzing carbamoyl-phosphate synthase small subunit [Chitinophagales bacterium]